MDDKDDKKIIEFPSLKEREAKEHALRKQEQQKQKALKKAQHVPFINWNKVPPFSRIILISLIVIHATVSFGLDDFQTMWVVHHYGFTPAFYTGAIPWSWSALIAPVTTLFLHGDWMHLMFNIIMLMAMGVFCERQFGAKVTALVFIMCGMAGNLVYFALNPTLNIPVIGASGAISGLFAVSLMFMIESGHMGPDIQKKGPLPFILLWSTIIIAVGLLVAGTAWQSHLGGFLGGIALVQLQKKNIIKLFW